MIRHRLIGIICLSCIVSLLLLSLPQLQTGEVDYQKTADGARWGWSDSAATPFWGISQAGDKYNLRIDVSHENRSGFRYSVLLDDRIVYTWMGHPRTVFRILNDRLYYAKFSPSSSGGNIVAVDLSTGKELWETRLKALGAVQHFAYSNLLTLDANYEVVSIYGNESFGRYLEYKDVNTGKTVGHRLFEQK